MPISGRKKTSSGGNTQNMNTRYQPQKEAKKTIAKFGVVSSDSPSYSQIGMNINEYDVDNTNNTEEGETLAPLAVLGSEPPASGNWTPVPDNEALIFTFNHTIDETTVNSTNIKITPTGEPGIDIPGTFVVNNNVVEFTPDIDWVDTESFTATVNSGVKSVQGLSLSEDYSITFVIEAAVGFTLTGSDPAHASFDVILTKPIEMTFNENVNPATVNDINITVTDLIGGVPVAGSFNVVDNVVTFTPDAPYFAGTTIRTVITTNVESVGGTPLAAEESFDFITEGGGPII